MKNIINYQVKKLKFSNLRKDIIESLLNFKVEKLFPKTQRGHFQNLKEA